MDSFLRIRRALPRSGSLYDPVGVLWFWQPCTCGSITIYEGIRRRNRVSGHRSFLLTLFAAVSLNRVNGNHILGRRSYDARHLQHRHEDER